MMGPEGLSTIVETAEQISSEAWPLVVQGVYMEAQVWICFAACAMTLGAGLTVFGLTLKNRSAQRQFRDRRVEESHMDVVDSAFAVTTCGVVAFIVGVLLLSRFMPALLYPEAAALLMLR